MKRIILSVLFICLLTACGDPSPIRSSVEVKYNELFGTKFGVIDQVYINSGENVLTVMGAEEFLSYLDDVKKVKGKEGKKGKGNIIISLKTSDGMKEYSKEQTTEALSYDSIKNVLCNNEECYKSKSLTKLITTYENK